MTVHVLPGKIHVLLFQSSQQLVWFRTILYLDHLFTAQANDIAQWLRSVGMLLKHKHRKIETFENLSLTIFSSVKAEETASEHCKTKTIIIILSFLILLLIPLLLTVDQILLCATLSMMLPWELCRADQPFPHHAF